MNGLEWITRDSCCASANFLGQLNGLSSIPRTRGFNVCVKNRKCGMVTVTCRCRVGSVSIVRRFDSPTVSRVNFKAQPLKLRLALTLTQTLTDTGGAVLIFRIIEPSDYRADTVEYTDCKVQF